MRAPLISLSLAVMVSLSGCQRSAPSGEGVVSSNSLETQNALLSDSSDGADWPAYGRTYGEQHFSPLTDINDTNVNRLGLSWSMDLGANNPASIPVAVNGTLYLSTGLSIVQAVDAATGKVKWQYDPEVGARAGGRLRVAWGIRGIAYWNGKVYTGTQDGRLIAIDAKTGQPVWSAETVDKDDGRYITGAPRVFDGKIIIGHGGADSANVRGYVTTYDAETGRLLWRFFLVPGDPKKGFEDKAQEMAAKTWTGEWWKFGGGGTAWNAFTFDHETNTIFVGVGNGAPWNQKVRSPAGGDNLFLCSVLALDAKTGAYKWHYQINPGETWDYNAAMDMELAELKIGNTLRKVLMTAPKNGFFYVIDRTNGKLISAEKIAKVTWASKIDLESGRPVETPGARFPDGKPFELWPNFNGAHSWMPMAFSPKTNLIYIPVLNGGAIYSDNGIDPKTWKRRAVNEFSSAVNLSMDIKDPAQGTSKLLAWNPATQKKAWEVTTSGGWNGGVLATGGNLVLQGQVDGRFSAYAADSGKELWRFDAQAPVIAAPITYKSAGRQYVTVLVGMGTSAGVNRDLLGKSAADYRTQKKRVLTFALDGSAQLPKLAAQKLVPAVDPDYKPNPILAQEGQAVYIRHCFVCHGLGGRSGGTAPDLIVSNVPASLEAFQSIVRDGGLEANGMPQFRELSARELDGLRQYIRQATAEARNRGR